MWLKFLAFFFIFFCYLGGINLSSWVTFPSTKLFFVGSLDLRLISGKGIVRLSFVFILIRSFIVVLSRGVVCVFFPNGLYPFRYLESISLIQEVDCKLAFVSVLTVFSAIASNTFRSCPQLFN